MKHYTELQPIEINVGHNQQAFTPQMQEVGDFGLTGLVIIGWSSLLVLGLSGLFSKPKAEAPKIKLPEQKK